MINMVNDIVKYFGLLIISLLFPLLTIACKDTDDGVRIPDNWIEISTDKIEFAYEGGQDIRNFQLVTGIDESELQVSLSNGGDDWLTVTTQNGRLQVLCERSYVERERSTTLILSYDDNHHCSISVTQAKAPSSADMLIKVTSAEATSQEEDSKDSDGNPLTIAMSCDGNKKTYYNSKFGAVTYPFYLTYTLEQGHTLNSIVYTPRTDSGNKWGSFDEFSVEVSTEEQPNFAKVGEYVRGNGVHTPFTIKFPEGIVGVKQVRFVITKAYEDRVSCAEMEFFQASENRFDPASIFADQLGTILKEGVTQKQINQIPNKYLKETAQSLLDGTYSMDYRLSDYRPYQNPVIMATKNKTNKYSLRDNPTGIFTKWGETIPVFVGKIPQGRKISILIQDVSGGYNNFREYELDEGYNEVTADVGGLIYVLNHVDDDIPLPIVEATDAQNKVIRDNTVTLHFAGGKVNGYFDIAKNTEDDWLRILNNAQYQDIDVLGHYSHLTWKVEDFKKYNTKITESIQNLDNLVYAELDFIGLVKYARIFNNRMHCSIDYKAASPNASDYRTVYSDNGYANLFTDISVWKQRFWGPAHEVGHCNQTRPGMKWSGLTEVTNNLTALHVEETLGIECRALTDGWYQSSYDLIVKQNIDDNPDNDVPHCIGYSDDGYNKVSEKLVPFWQLKLYFIDALGMKDFYRDLYEYYRTHESPSDTGKNQGSNQLDFVRQVCRISGYNMLDFFKAWGFLCPVDTKLNDYGTKEFIITQEEINQLIEEINDCNYKRPHTEVYLITDANYQDFK